MILFEIDISGCSKNGLALQYASWILQNSNDVVLTAVQQDGEALKYASIYLKDQKDIVMLAVENKPSALHFATERVQNFMYRSYVFCCQ